jgi:hypothetical protein
MRGENCSRMDSIRPSVIQQFGPAVVPKALRGTLLQSAGFFPEKPEHEPD